MTKRRKGRKISEAFANAKIDKLIRDAGAFRVSAGAIRAMNAHLTTKGVSIAKHAIEIAKHGGRKTVQESDIELASANL